MKTIVDLQDELSKTKEVLKYVDENIKRLIGRDPGEQQKRFDYNDRTDNRDRKSRRSKEDDAPDKDSRDFRQQKRSRLEYGSREKGDSRNFQRFSKAHEEVDSGDDDDSILKPSIASRIFATPQEVKSRQQHLAEQTADKKNRDRNRRMFGVMLGTLQKFRQEETKQKAKEEKRAQIEKKLEDAEKHEKETIVKERRNLYLSRRKAQEQIRRLESKMTRLKEVEEWESKQLLLVRFIRTNTKPHIFYIPRILNNYTKERLAVTRTIITETIVEKRKSMQEEFDEEENIQQRKAEEESGNWPRQKKEDSAIAEIAETIMEQYNQGYMELGNDGYGVPVVVNMEVEEGETENTDVIVEPEPSIKVEKVDDAIREIPTPMDNVPENIVTDDIGPDGKTNLQLTIDPVLPQVQTDVVCPDLVVGEEITTDLNASMQSVDEKEFKPMYD